jgi:alkylated DNA repair dioxygenase AlkB
MNPEHIQAPGEATGAFDRFSLPDADVLHYAALFTRCEADRLFRELRNAVDWRADYIRLFGRVHAVPRLTAWYGTPGATYTYSGLRMEAAAWLPVLLVIRERIERVSGTTFNSVLLNLYRNESDSVSWHADDEPELGHDPVIGSVSFGASREFRMRHRRHRSLKQAITLEHGSFLLMQGATQHHWVHQVPKSRRPCGERINLTFRSVS